MVVIQVKDTGIGIPEHALPSIFDMFSQVERKGEQNTRGLGIGLSLVKGLVEMHDGTVSFQSEEECRHRIHGPYSDHRRATSDRNSFR